VSSNFLALVVVGVSGFLCFAGVLFFVVNVVLVFSGDIASIIVVEGEVLVFVIGFGDAAQGVAFKIGLNMLAIAVLDQVSGGVDALVGLA